MDQKQCIIQALINESDFITAKEIARRTGISCRSVRYYISVINQTHSDSIVSSARGYRLINRQIFHGQHTTSLCAPINYTSRRKYILRELLMHKRDFTIDTLSAQLYISPATLSNELSRIRCELAPKNLKLHIRQGHISISGSDRDMRSYFTELVRAEAEDGLISRDSLQAFFTIANLRDIENTVLSVLAHHDLYLDDQSLLMVVVPLAVFIEFYSEKALDVPVPAPPEPGLIREQIKNIVIEIMQALSQHYSFVYTEANVFEYSLILMTRVVSDEIQSVTPASLSKYVDVETERLLYYLIDAVKKAYSIDLGSDSFVVRFAFHLQNLVVRLRNGIAVANRQSCDIKNSYPFMYSIAVYISYLICEKVGVELSDEEISYIALYVGVAIEENEYTQRKLQCILFSPDHYATGQSIYRRISGIFGQQLEIKRFITTFAELNQPWEADLILSTVPLSQASTFALHISHFVTSEDVKAITAAINTLQRAKKDDAVRRVLQYFFRKELFFYGNFCRTDVETIDFLCAQMLRSGYVDEDFRASVYAREAISKSAYDSIAIPHPISCSPAQSAIAVFLNPDGILWGDHTVYAVFMLSISQDEVEQFSNMFDIIHQLTGDPLQLQQLLQVTRYEDFIDLAIESRN